MYKTSSHPRSISLTSLGLWLACASLARAAGFTPIAINPSSYNQDVVVEAAAPKSLSDQVTATMDSGTNRSGNTFYEAGYNLAFTPTNSDVGTGLPVHGSLVSSNVTGGISAGNYAFRMPPEYHTNNVLMVGHAGGARTPIIGSGTLSMTPPISGYNGLAFLVAAGNGPVTITYLVHYSDTTTDTGTSVVFDWFNNVAGNNRVYNCGGRVSLGGGVQNVIHLAPGGDLTLSNSAAALYAVNTGTAGVQPGKTITSVDFSYLASGGNGIPFQLNQTGTANTNNSGRAVILAISGANDANAGNDYTNPIAVAGFNYNAIVPVDGIPTTGMNNAGGSILTNNVTATMDGGTSMQGNCWFEQGYYRAFPNLGVPAAGSTISSKAISATYTMPASYATNCAICLGSNIPVANITLNAPAAYGALSFLCAAANTGNNADTDLPCILQFQNGTSETNVIYCPGWLTTSIPFAYLPFGRVTPSNRTINDTGDQFVDPFALGLVYDYDWRAGGQQGYGLPAPNLFDAVVNINNTSGTVTNIQVLFTNGVSPRFCSIFAVSGAPASQVPPVFGVVGSDTPGAANFYARPGQPTYYFNPSNRVHAVVNNMTLIKKVQGGGSAVSQATATAQINANGNITNVLVTSGGGGYTYTPVVTVVDPAGSNATFSVTLFNGVITGIPVSNQGTNYSGAATIVIGPPPPNDIVLSVTNIAGTGPITYQWKSAPRGGGFHDRFFGIDYNTFANLTDGGRVSGSGSSSLVISNAQLTDDADYLVVASNPYGAVTSRVASVYVLSTNINVLVGVPGGDIQTPISTDSSPAAESIDHAIDQVAQKWLSDGLQFSPCCGGGGQTPWVGFASPPSGLGAQVGYVVQPVAGASVVTGMRIYAANDTPGRDPFDFGLEGSNDGSTWAPIGGAALKGTLMLTTGRNGSGAAALDPIANSDAEFEFANATAYKYYRVTLTNVYDTLQQPLMQVGEIELLGTLVPNPPAFVVNPPAGVTVYVGGSPTFTVKATGSAPKFQWLKNGVPIPGATAATISPGVSSSSYTFTNAQLANSGTNFSCIASNAFGNVTSTTVTLTVIPAPTDPYPSAVIADSPIGFWRLDEPESGGGNNGVTAVDHMGGHNGYYTNTVLGLPGFSGTADPDTAAGFGASGSSPIDSFVAGIDNVDFASPANGPARAFSVEAWAFMPIGTSLSPSAMVAKGYNGSLAVGTGTGTEQYALDLTNSGSGPMTYRFLVRDAAGNGYAALSPPSVANFQINNQLGKWVHLVGVCDQPNGNIYLYVNGILAASATIPNNAGILSQPLSTTIGSRQSGGNTDYDQEWNGTLDEVAIYNKALSPARILAHFYSGEQAPVITLQPINLNTNANVLVSFFSQAYGVGTLNYQWYNSDGANPTTPVSGANGSNYTFTTTAGQSGNFYVMEVANAYGATTSSVVQLTVQSGPPGFLFQDLPASSSIGMGHVITMHVGASGTAPFTYQWQRYGTNIADDYRTSGSQTDTLFIGYATLSDTAPYNVLVSNGSGTGGSTTNSLTVVSNPPGSSVFGSGFFGATGNPSTWNLQGTPSPAVLTTVGNSNTLQMTFDAGNTARSAWLINKQNIASFSATFLYQMVVPSANTGADGISFCIQNSSVTALGGGGGSLGVSGISPSWELELNIYNPNTRGIVFETAGTIPAAGTGGFFPIPPIDIGGNSDVIRIDITYNGTVLTAKFTDENTLAVVTTNQTINIPSTVGGSTAWVGFTGADGGVNSTQAISFGPGAAQRIPLTFTKVGKNLVLSWPSSQGAFLLVSPSLTAPAWVQDQTDTFRVVGANGQVIIPPLSQGQFYRLELFP